MNKIKRLSQIKGFDDVGIGIIPCGEGDGTYVLYEDVKGYDLTDIQLYHYNTFLRTMTPTDVLGNDTGNYCVKRSDLERKET